MKGAREVGRERGRWGMSENVKEGGRWEGKEVDGEIRSERARMCRRGGRGGDGEERGIWVGREGDVEGK